MTTLLQITTKAKGKTTASSRGNTRMQPVAPGAATPVLVTPPLRPIYCRQSSRQWYTITPPQWPNISVPLTMTLAEREKLRRVGRENNATAGIVCSADVKAVFNFEFDDIDIDVPLEEFLVEASKETPRWRVILTPLPRATDEPDSQPTPSRGDRVI